jgi:hypothetical protein
LVTTVPLRLLLLEDNAGDARLVREALAEHAPGEFALTCVERLADALARIGAECFDIVLCDLGLPDSAGLATVQAVIDRAPALPLVVRGDRVRRAGLPRQGEFELADDRAHAPLRDRAQTP